mgnify:CR=1 FL=1
MPISESALANIPGLSGILAARQFNQESTARDTQNTLGQVGLAAKLQEMQMQRVALEQAQMLREALAKGDMATIAKLPGGLAIIKQMSDIQNAGATGDWRRAQAANLTSQGAQRELQTAAGSELVRTITPPPNVDPTSPPPQTFGNPQDAAGAVAAATARGELMTGFVPDQGRVQALSVLANPQAAVRQILANQKPAAARPATPLPLERAIAARDALAPNDPKRRLYDSFIEKVSASPDKPLTDFGKLNEDLKAGRITQEQFEAGSKTKLGEMSVIPKEHADLHGDDYLATLTPGLQNTVKAIVEGKVPLTSFSVRNNQRDAMIQRAAQYDPTFEAGKAPARMAVQKDFTSGVASRNVTAINTAIRHIGTLDELGQALDNKDVQVANKVINSIRNQLGDPRVNNFDTAKSAVGNELMRVFRQVNASDQETKDWESKFSSAQSPAQMRGAIKVGVELLDGRIKALDEQWMRGMDTNKGYPNLLTPTAKDILGRIGGNPKRRAADTAPANPELDVLLKKYGG